MVSIYGNIEASPKFNNEISQKSPNIYSDKRNVFGASSVASSIQLIEPLQDLHKQRVTGDDTSPQ